MDGLMDAIEYGMHKWVRMLHSEDKTVYSKIIHQFSEVLNEIKLVTPGLAQRAGLRTSGAVASQDKPDPRSLLEAELSEEVYKRVVELFNFVENKMEIMGWSDKGIASTISFLDPLWEELEGRNQAIFDAQGVEVPRESRVYMTADEIEEKVRIDIALEIAPIKVEGTIEGKDANDHVQLDVPSASRMNTSGKEESVDEFKAKEPADDPLRAIRNGLIDAMEARRLGVLPVDRGCLLAAIQKRGAE